MKSAFLPLLLLSLPLAAHAAKKAPPAPEITTSSQRLTATCPPPQRGPCAMANPTEESQWRVLTPGVEIEPAANGWLVDFSKGWKEGTQKSTLRVLSGSGQLREIDVTFRK